MGRLLLVAVWAISCPIFCPGYDLTGRVEPASAVSVSLHGAIVPFERSTASEADGHFRFARIPAGTYTLVISTAARGDVTQTVELTSGTVDSKGRLDVVLAIDDSRLESDANRSGATVSATVLTISERAMKEYEEAQRCLSSGDTDCATLHLRIAVEKAPRFAAAWNQLGTIDYQSHRYTDAETNFRTALEADPEAFEPLVNLGGVLLNLGRPREALGYNQQAVARRPNDALANSQLGLAYVQVGEEEQAEKFLNTAIHLDPANFSHPQLTLAGIYLHRGDRKSALTELRDFLQRHPDSPDAEGVRARIAALSR